MAAQAAQPNGLERATSQSEADVESARRSTPPPAYANETQTDQKLSPADEERLATKLAHSAPSKASHEHDDAGGARASAAHCEPGLNQDSGYAWVILAVMFLLQANIGGAGRMSGIVYAEQVRIGYYDREQASWPTAAAAAVENLGCLLTPALTQVMSWRQIELFGTALFIAANALAYVSSSLLVDIVTLGVIQGIGLSMTTVLSLAINNDFFVRYRTSAMGAAMSGSTFGTLLLTPIVEWILRTFHNFRLVYLALSGAFCVNLALVLLIKPRAQTLKRRPTLHASSTPNKTKANTNTNTQTNVQTTQQHCHASLCAKQHEHLHKARSNQSQSQTTTTTTQTPTPTPTVAGTNLDERRALHRQSSRFERRFERQSSLASISDAARSLCRSKLERKLTNASSGEQASNALAFGACEPSDTNTGSADTNVAPPHTSDAAGAPPLRRLDSLSLANQIMLAAAAAQNSKRNSLAAMAETSARHASVASVATLCEKSVAATVVDYDSPPPPPPSDVFASCAKKAEAAVAEAEAAQAGAESHGLARVCQLGAKLLCTPYLHVTWIMLSLYYLIARTFVIILVDFAMDHSIGLDEAGYLVQFWSVGEPVGRLLLGSLIDLRWLSVKCCITSTCYLLAAIIGLMVSVEHYYVYAFGAFAVAALISLEYMLINALIWEYLGEQHVTTCYSIAAFISSLVLFARPALIGLCRDTLGSYDLLLVLLGGMTFAFAALFHLLEPLFVRNWPKAAAAAAAS